MDGGDADGAAAGGAADGGAPFVNMTIFSRGMLSHAFTRIYFYDEIANGSDLVLSTVPESRRETLIAMRRETADGVAYEFSIRMQGDGETVFFDA